MHHESKVVESILKEARAKNAKSVKILVGELSGYTAKEIKKALEFSIPCEVKEEESIVDCVCGYMDRAKITERDQGIVLFECPTCGRVPEILKGSDVILKEICV